MQSVDDSVLRLLGRDHTAEEGLMLLKQSQEIFGPNSVTVDFLFGKPGDTVASLVTELNQILDFNLSHISVYELTPEKGTKLFSQV
jgi:oxygen-independent coproporphyrinogen-3 oxidase